MAWEKGKSGNPGGRPKSKEYTLTKMIKEYGMRKYKKTNRTNYEQLVVRLFEEAHSHNDKTMMSAAKYIIDRIDGRPKETIDMTQHIVDYVLEAPQPLLEPPAKEKKKNAKKKS